MKRLFNRAVRRKPVTEESERISSKRMYRKYRCSWDICDYESVGVSFREYWGRVLQLYIEDCARGHEVPPPDKKKEYRNWYKMFKAK